ncbi:MAG: FAD-binding protein [Rhodospirillaceae bacterium]|nr:MAG: FAD-binding protein [Rhodospirillaceae bacterium]
MTVSAATSDVTSSPGRIHIIGAGVAGLAAALRLRHFGSRVTVYEAAPRAGGRCRSFADPQLGMVIDNGNHLLLSGNHAAMAYLAECGASDRVVGPEMPEFRFVDIGSGQRWSVRPGRGPIPWWILNARRRVPDTGIADYWSVVRLLHAHTDATIAQCVDPASVLYRRFWEPLTLAVLNTAPEHASAALMRAVLQETVAKGADACRPLVARTSLADALVDPAMATLAKTGVSVRVATRVRAVTATGISITSLTVEDEEVPVTPNDVVILAVPAWVAETLIGGLTVPPPGEPIVNVHYRLPAEFLRPDPVEIVGVVGGMTQWVFMRGEMASVTISAAGAVEDLPAEEIISRCWPEVAAALALGTIPVPPARVIKERRATPAQTPAAVGMRPEATTRYNNLLLAGDWTATGLPATIEAAVRSGFAAAALATARPGKPAMASSHKRGAA